MRPWIDNEKRNKRKNQCVVCERRGHGKDRGQMTDSVANQGTVCWLFCSLILIGPMTNSWPAGPSFGVITRYLCFCEHPHSYLSPSQSMATTTIVGKGRGSGRAKKSKSKRTETSWFSFRVVVDAWGETGLCLKREKDGSGSSWEAYLFLFVCFRDKDLASREPKDRLFRFASVDTGGENYDTAKKERRKREGESKERAAVAGFYGCVCVFVCVCVCEDNFFRHDAPTHTPTPTPNIHHARVLRVGEFRVSFGLVGFARIARILPYPHEPITEKQTSSYHRVLIHTGACASWLPLVSDY